MSKKSVYLDTIFEGNTEIDKFDEINFRITYLENIPGFDDIKGSIICINFHIILLKLLVTDAMLGTFFSDIGCQNHWFCVGTSTRLLVILFGHILMTLRYKK